MRAQIIDWINENHEIQQKLYNTATKVLDKENAIRCLGAMDILAALHAFIERIEL